MTEADNADAEQDSKAVEFERQAELSEHGFIEEFTLFLRENKKWWLVPLLGSLFVVGLLSFLTGSVAAPFIYTLF